MSKFEVNGFTYTILTDTTVKIGEDLDYQYHNAVKSETCPSIINIPSVVKYGKEYTVTTINDNAFYSCRGITSISIPESVTRIGSSSFDKLGISFEIKLPSKLEYIGSYTFSSNSYTTITIPASVKSIGLSPFGHNTEIKSIYVEAGSRYFTTENNVALLDYNKKRLINVVSTSTFIVPETVKTFDVRCMAYCTIDTLVIHAKLSVLNFRSLACYFKDVYIYGNIKNVNELLFESVKVIQNIHYFGSREINTLLTGVPSSVVYHVCTGYKGNTVFGHSFKVEYCSAYPTIKCNTLKCHRNNSYTITYLIVFVLYK